MKPNMGFKYIMLMCIIAFSSSMIGYISGVRADNKKPAQIDPMTVSAPFQKGISALPAQRFLPPDSHADEVTTTYVLKEHSGKIALFSKHSGGDETIYREYDISVSLLPAADRKRLAEGIELDSFSDALQLVEDYSS